MAEPNPIYAAPTELYRYLNVYGYKYFAPTELLPRKRRARARNAERRTPNAERQTPNASPCTLQNEFYLPCSLHDSKTFSVSY
ncbi:MAG: hypothetical protein JOZ08_11240 [Verrucomicrobia bacterium]|nr:hypothetical protein [Verrucomicrobiota bacterium]